MESGSITTPFGRRSMTLGMIASQVTSRRIDAHAAIDKWKLYRALCEARPLLGITDRSLALLHALMSFYPKNELHPGEHLVVFPSNAQLSIRANGMAEQTIRRHLAVLVDAGLLVRRDSPNGKRYAYRNKTGDIEQAFGFSLAPLLARAAEIKALADQVIAARLHLHKLRERLTLCRRNITKLVDIALGETASASLETIRVEARAVLQTLPRGANATQVEPVLRKLEAIEQDLINQLENQLKQQKSSGNVPQTERHLQNTESDSYSESEANDAGIHLRKGPEQGKQPSSLPRMLENSEKRESSKSLKVPLSLVLQACPQIRDYGPGGMIGNWQDLVSAASLVSSMLGITPQTYEETCAMMGREDAAIVIACILERGGHINSPGAYLRDLTRRARQGLFALNPMLMALMRTSDSVGQNIRTVDHFRRSAFPLPETRIR